MVKQSKKDREKEYERVNGVVYLQLTDYLVTDPVVSRFISRLHDDEDIDLSYQYDSNEISITYYVTTTKNWLTEHNLTKLLNYRTSKSRKHLDYSPNKFIKKFLEEEL